MVERIEALSDGELVRRHQAAERALLRMGITFNVYGEEPSSERIFPFDIIPRIVSSADWAVIEHGLQQRIQALNHFIDDAYHAQRIVKDGVVPAEGLASSQQATHLVLTIRARRRRPSPPAGTGRPRTAGESG